MSFKFNKQEILKIQRNKGQYLMMDEAYNVVPKTCAESKKFLPSDEWFFKQYWADSFFGDNKIVIVYVSLMHNLNKSISI